MLQPADVRIVCPVVVSPGAYTSICSSKHVPNYNERYQELRDQGVDTIACLSVNDPW